MSIYILAVMAYGFGLLIGRHDLKAFLLVFVVTTFLVAGLRVILRQPSSSNDEKPSA